MTDSTSGTRLCIWHLVLVPAVISLGVTLLRLVGELQHWNQALFNSAAGGVGAIVGISWLPFIFGPYFAVKLARAGEPAKSVAKTIVFAFLGVLLCFGGIAVMEAPKINFPGKTVVGLVLMGVAGLTILPFWPSFFKTLIAYAYAARVPVLVVMFFAMRGSWGTHYDAVPPGYPAATAFWPKFADLAFFPQMVFWVAYTIAVGAFIGGIFAALVVRRRQVE
jgi:hypothetical protein